MCRTICNSKCAAVFKWNGLKCSDHCIAGSGLKMQGPDSVFAAQSVDPLWTVRAWVRWHNIQSPRYWGHDKVQQHDMWSCCVIKFCLLLAKASAGGSGHSARTYQPGSARKVLVWCMPALLLTVLLISDVMSSLPQTKTGIHDGCNCTDLRKWDHSIQDVWRHNKNLTAEFVVVLSFILLFIYLFFLVVGVVFF